MHMNVEQQACVRIVVTRHADHMLMQHLSPLFVTHFFDHFFDAAPVW